MELFEKELFICIKMDLALNNLQWLMCHKTKPNKTNVSCLSYLDCLGDMKSVPAQLLFCRVLLPGFL